MATDTDTAASSQQLKAWANDPEQARLHLRSIVASLSDEELCDWASEALENLGCPLASDLPFLVGQLTDSSSDVQYWSCTLIGRLQKAASSAATRLQALIEVPGTPSHIKQRAQWALNQVTNGQEA